MTTVNHVVTGAVIGTFFKQPLLVVPVAFASHFVLDVMPHYGIAGKGGYEDAFKHEATFLTESLGLLGILVLLAFGLVGWDITLLGALAAVMPDLSWPYEYFRHERLGKPVIKTGFIGFHRHIQWCERPWGLIVEIMFFIAMTWLLSYLKQFS